MRVLLTTLAANTHLYLMVPLAHALRAAGHEVVVASGPELVPDITGAGLPAAAVGKQLDMVEDARQAEYGDTVHGSEYDITEIRPERLTWDYARNVLRVWCQGPVAAYDYLANDPMVDDLLRFSRWWKPDVIVWDATTYAGPIVAQIIGVPQVRFLFGLDQTARIHRIFTEGLPQQPAAVREDPLADPLVEMLTRKLARHNTPFARELMFGEFSIDPTPEWMRFPVEHDYRSISPVLYNGPSVIPQWLTEPVERRRICITLGLSLREIDDHWGEGINVSTVLEAVDGLDIEVVATIPGDVLEGVAVPENVRAVDFVPMDALLPSCSAIVHHGGGGTRLNALMHGVPQLVIPGWSWDEAIQASKYAERGAAVVVPQEELTAQRLRDGLLRLLDEPSFAAAAADLQKIARSATSPADTVAALEALVAGHRGQTAGVAPLG
ncbi:activator-dependent family glycosyltransferase [Micromonospora sp. FIMYZ51]|uniref:activator-dependent family glycosyltransferase n=1 Tax=Micromonospora sp. FIMYZ51 TaxID=3051832 RepID=UPI00311E4DE8